jgi:uncharacterized SAM-binding protein YcdF (DUF218 family)
MMSWLLSLPLAVGGVFMVLYGVGEWGRWGYLLVFLSIAVTFIACSFADSLLFPHSGKEHVPFALLITGVAAFLTLAAVRSYYERRVQHQTPIQLDETDAG